MRSGFARPLSSELLGGTIMNHRVLWVALDTMLIAHVCLLNPWFRNFVPGWADREALAGFHGLGEIVSHRFCQLFGGEASGCILAL